MALRVLLLCILFTVGLLTGRSTGAAGLELSLGFARQPQDAVGVRSRPLTLECVVTSTLPEVNISWTHDGKLLQFGPAESRRVLLENGSLHFKKVQYKKAGSQDTSDQGEYRCIARNAVGALISRPAQLRIAVLASSFTECPSDMTAEAGDVVRFVCQIDSFPKAQISWERNGKPLPQNNRTVFLDSGDLYLTDVQPTDMGTYRCIATNVASKKQRASPEGVLTVVARSPSSQWVPKFLPPLMPLVQAIQGNNVVLACAVTGPSVWELQWTRSSPSEQQVIVMNRTSGGVNVLAVNNITSNHTGNYTCTAKTPGAQTITQDVRDDYRQASTFLCNRNLEGALRSSPLPKTDLQKNYKIQCQVVRIDVWVPPMFKVNGTPVSEVYPPAKTVRFKCDAQGVPKPDIIWLKDGERVQMNGRIKQRASELVLLNGVTADSGLYQCVARNKAGENWAAGRLQVNASRSQPDPPKNLTCRTVSSSQVVLSWDKSSKLDVMAYTVHYFTGGGDEQQKVALNNTLLVDKLAPYTNYTFYVRAYSGRSASELSAHIACQTGEDVPQAAPKLIVEAASPTTARVTWTPLPNEKARGLITEYKIQWRRSSHPSSNVDEVKGDVLEYTITGLHPGKMYEIRVLAATKKGWPDLSDDQLGWTTLQMPSYGPQNVPKAPLVNLTVINSSCIEVVWSLSPDNLYPPEGFKLFYRKQTSQQVGPVILPANTTRYLLGGLEPNTWYEVHVLGFGEGDGEVGVQTMYTLPDTEVLPSLPQLSPPSYLEAVPTSPNAINLTWTPPPVSNVAFYNVTYAPVIQRGGNSTVSYIRAIGSGVEISSLKPYTLYEFKVRTHDRQNQFGPYSQKVECHTMEDVPGVVQDVQWKPLNKTSIRVSWKEPVHTNGIINSYLVSITQDTSQPATEWKQQRVPGSQSNTELVGLSSKGHYFLSVRAATQAGHGPPSAILMVTIPFSHGEQLNEVNSSGSPSDQHLGILVGVVIGIICIIICSVTIVWRRRYLQGNPAHASSNVQHANGNGYYREWDHSPINPQESELQELEYCVNVAATNIPPPNHSLLDTKGGYPGGQANGLKHPLLSNGRIPNGHSGRDRNSVHITENPQVRPSYKCRDMPVEKQRPQNSPSQESRLNGEDSECPADHHLPLLGDTNEHSIVSSEDHHDEDDDDDDHHHQHHPDVINCTQLTQLSSNFGSSNEVGTTVSQPQPPREK
ncbi:protogenin [Anabrus simplex]|uniref:protogenin n=1 Tax=Anabrus simplex TaxID=316456 RepID=UPI0035A27DB6